MTLGYVSPPRKVGVNGTVEEGVVELTAYSVKLRKVVAIKDPELVTLKNGRMAVRGVAEEDPSSKVTRIVSDKQAEEVRRMLG